ncbi:hypothetical protein ACH9L7_19700 (plasmid) [Haloferax sp. S1W]|uniref:hypothetical protein n=1 Tax=Haloferax TaxID=2251 RepID=UPI001375C187|nr:hypothetical protein [Haloferax prahovense]
MVSTLILGAILTLLAWVGLQAAVIHGKYVVDKIDSGEYQKGPFSDAMDGGSNE